MKLKVPELSLIVLIGPSGCGKSTFARSKLAPFESISSDFCRGLVANDENALHVNEEAFAILHAILRQRMKLGLLTAVDATNVSPASRREYVAIAREFHMLPVAIVFDLPRRLCEERNATRPDRDFGPHVIRNQHREMIHSLRGLEKEGFRHVLYLKSEEEATNATIVREPLYNNKRGEVGPFDIIGDVHGCYDELRELLERLGYAVGEDEELTPPAGRRAIFVGDLVDRGPATPRVLKLAMRAVADGSAFCVPGNHDIKLMRALKGKHVKIAHGLQASLDQLAAESDEFRRAVVKFLDDLVSHYVLDGGRLVVAHAGMKESMQGRGSGGVREFALYGETTGEIDEFGLPVRINWAEEYRGRALVVYGHTPVPQPQFLNGTVNIDTGCVFGGALTAYRYPEGETVSVAARAQYAEPARPIGHATPLSQQQLHDSALFLEDVTGRRAIETRLHRRITIREANTDPALEVMSRFTVDPRWLIYLPPTMSPTETTQREGLLEHPEAAFRYYAEAGVPAVICEEKHMGSRAVAIVCRDAEAMRRRFGILEGEPGVVYSRTGRPFFNKEETNAAFLAELRDALDRAGVWEELATDWIALDAELMPWSAKAGELLRRQYAPAGASGTAMLAHAQTALAAARASGVEGLEPLEESAAERAAAVRDYVAAYRRYCWEVTSLADYRFAPFHILATEGAMHFDRDHRWHMETIAGIVARGGSPLLHATPYRIVDLADPAAIADATAWWETLTAAGGEGMVVKPLSFVAKGEKGLLQPAVKCRGREYLRIIYGPEYTRAENLRRLRDRAVAHKRSMALREFALGHEALTRFTERQPLRRVHECVFGVLALETEPVDPRL